MRRNKIGAATAVLALAAVSACSVTSDEGTDSSKSLTVGWNQPFYSANDQTSTGNNATNGNINYVVNEQFLYYDENSKLVKNESFGTYEKTSDDPLTVKYTVNEDSKWSDGTPVTAADIIVGYGANSGTFNTVTADKVKFDENTGNPTVPEGQAYFNSAIAGANGFQYVTKFPTVSEDGQSVTFVYDKPYAAWEDDLFNQLRTPAHILAEKALKTTDVDKGKQAVIDAFEDKDAAALAKIANFWNTGWDFTDTPEDKDLLVNSGPYTITSAKADSHVTLTANKEYKGDRAGKVGKITVKFIPDITAALQAVKNGELDAYEGQSTVDAVKAAKKDKIDMISGLESTYEHIDLTVDNGGPFDPKSYGGDAEKAKKVRQAFLLAYPRQEIMDKLIVPQVESAKLRTSLTTFDGTKGYGPVSKANGHEFYDPSADNIKKAKDLLAEAGVTKPKVRELYDKTNPRRAAEYALASAALTEAGFEMVDIGDPAWSSLLGTGKYDAVFFGWNSTSPSVIATLQNYYTGAGSNFQGLSSKAADAGYDKLQFTTDEDEQIELLKEIDKAIYDEAVTLPIFEFPGVVFYDKASITGLEPGYLSPNLFQGFWNWDTK